MPQVIVKTTIAAPIERVWASWDDYANIARFNPNLSGSHLLPGSAPTGLGAERQCDFADGKNHIRERVVGYEPERRLVVDVYDGTVPLRSAYNTIAFRATGADRTEVTMTLDFAPAYGLVGRLMVPLMKRQLQKGLRTVLDGNAAYVERGETVPAAA